MRSKISFENFKKRQYGLLNVECFWPLCEVTYSMMSKSFIPLKGVVIITLTIITIAYFFELWINKKSNNNKQNKFL